MVDPAQRAGAVERTLRTLEYFDPIDVDQPDIRIGRGIRKPRLVEDHRDRRLAFTGKRAVRHSAQKQAVAPRSQPGQRQALADAGDGLGVAAGAAALAIVEADDAQRDRHLIERLRSLAAGHHDRRADCVRRRRGCRVRAQWRCGWRRCAFDPPRRRSDLSGDEAAADQQASERLGDAQPGADCGGRTVGQTTFRPDRHVCLACQFGDGQGQGASGDVDRLRAVSRVSGSGRGDKRRQARGAAKAP